MNYSQPDRRGGARVAHGEDNRIRPCMVEGREYPSIRTAADELMALGKGISYWMLYRALRKHKPQIGDVSIALAAEIRATTTREPRAHVPGEPLISQPMTGRDE